MTVRTPSALPVRRLLAGLCLLAALISGGCAGGSSTASSSAAVTRSRSRPSSGTTAPAGTASGSPTGTATSGQTTGTATSGQTTANLPGAGRPAVTIGDKNYTEQFVLGQLYLQALQGQGFTVDINQNIGPTDVITGALNNGALAMYPEYLDVFNTAIAGYRHGFASRSQAYAAARRYATAHGLELLAPTPFSDTDAIAVTVAYAARHGLRSLGDLQRVQAMLTVGGAVQFQQASPGLPLLAEMYGVTPAAFKALTVGDQYAELDDGSIQAAYVNTTDGELASGDYRLLRDPLRSFGWGNVVPVVSLTAAAREGPAFTATLQRVDSLLTTPAMRELNAAVDIAKQTPSTVARMFLETHGVPVPPSP